jgi:hypothetical protein
MDIPALSFLKKRTVPPPWVILGMLVLAVPFVLFLLSMKGCACAPVPADAAPATRTGPDSIHIVMRPDASYHHDKLPTVGIFVNDRDVSNRSMIAASHLPLAISPPEGLVFADGSAVTLQGIGVAGNKSAPVHLWILVTYPDTGWQAVIGEQFI